MLIFRYSKLGGAEYISHLDLMRHLQKTILRAGIPVKYSEGFNPHMLIFMSPPLFVGLKSESEYCLAETDTTASQFKEAFNAHSPKGIKCMTAFSVQKRHKIAGLIDGAEYIISGANEFDKNELFVAGGVMISDKNGDKKDVHEKVLKADFEADGRLRVVLKFGNDTLRADKFCEFLSEKYGGRPEAVKTQAFIGGVLPEECLK